MNNCFSVCCRNIGKDVFVELDVGSDNNPNEYQIRGVLYSVVEEGTIASYDTSVVGFQFRRLGEGMSVTAICAFEFLGDIVRHLSQLLLCFSPMLH